MKHIAALIALFFATTAFADDAPPVSAKQAVDLAEKTIAERGLGKTLYIESVTIQRLSMFSGKSYWFVKWSRTIPAINPKNREVGLKVNMDGSYVRLVKEPGAP